MTTHDHATDTQQRQIDRVRSLLAKAASSEFEAESEAFEAKALALMAEHEIAERDLREPSSFGEDLIDLTSFGRAGKGAACLAAWLTDLFGGYAVLVSQRDRKTGRVLITSTPSQRERIDAMLDHLLPQLRAALTRDRPRSRMSYSVAWADRVMERLRVTHEAAYEQRGALIPTNHEAKAAFTAQHGRARSSGVRIDAESAAAGTAAGDVADLGFDRLTS